MNCKPGDLAIVVGGKDLDPPVRGAIVRVGRISRDWPNAWELDPPCIDPRDGYEIHVPDHHLRPIRPGEGEDEMLTLAGKPQ